MARLLQIGRALAVTLGLAALVAACSDDAASTSSPDMGADGAADATDGAVDGADAAELEIGANADAEADGPPADAGLSPVTGPGPYNVGYRDGLLRYDPAFGEPGRELRLVYWYPTEESGGSSLYVGIIRREGVVEFAEPAGQGQLPVLLFSHGSNGVAEQSYQLTEFFASHGWLVVAPDHTGNTFSDTDGPVPPDLVIWRPMDISAVLDLLEELPESHFLAGRVSDRVAVAGHSFGGYTSLALAGGTFAIEQAIQDCDDGLNPDEICDILTEERIGFFEQGFVDPRIQAAIPLAPGAAAVFGEDGLAGIDIPVLLVTGSRDATTPNASEGDVVWTGLDDPDDRRIDFSDAGHFSFTSLCDSILGLAGVGDDDGCGGDFIDPDDVFAVVNVYALAFARLHVLGLEVDRPLLDGEEAVGSGFELSAH